MNRARTEAQIMEKLKKIWRCSGHDTIASVVLVCWWSCADDWTAALFFFLLTHQTHVLRILFS